MKRKDLTPGMVVEVRSGASGGLYTTYDRAIVLSLDRWEARRPGGIGAPRWSSWFHPLPDNVKGNGVPIAREGKNYWGRETGKWEPDVVQPGQLVPAGTGDVEAARKQAEREAADTLKREANERREADRVEIIGRLKKLGIDPEPVRVSGTVEMNKDTLCQILALAERPNVAGQNDIDWLNRKGDR